MRAAFFSIYRCLAGMSGFKPCLGRLLQPGGFCLSRSVGYTDVGEFIVLVPYVKQVKLSNAGGRLVIASDGICDVLSSDMAAQSCRGLPAELAAKLVVKVMSSIGSFF
ncbi:hypothetical protein LWI28_022306 [Acer negundo]|uniref:PPM-type phosphatase domain-containing protein n=1 Tax=Acer negundo TaxID=4023 RepID=A0AAD5J6X6_ACENE|nr:hypothetical protein LWI28_022306 [Acer negundo]